MQSACIGAHPGALGSRSRYSFSRVSWAAHPRVTPHVQQPAHQPRRSVFESCFRRRAGGRKVLRVRGACVVERAVVRVGVRSRRRWRRLRRPDVGALPGTHRAQTRNAARAAGVIHRGSVATLSTVLRRILECVKERNMISIQLWKQATPARRTDENRIPTFVTQRTFTP